MIDRADIITEPLTYIINLSITTNTVLWALREPLVTPIHKKGNKLNVTNYRLVSILGIASKILERAIYTQMEQYLTDNNILYKFQSGFRKAYSTDTCLIHLTDYLQTQMANGRYTGMVHLDLKKAFNTVNHAIPCDKLVAMGIGSRWFKSHLKERPQKVKVGDTMSDSMLIASGVPHGNILGPLLFLCYVNDMAKHQ